MIVCKKCKSEFKIRQVIDGKTHNLQRRKFCLNCSPFGQHNTRNLLNSKNKAPKDKRDRILFYNLKRLPTFNWKEIQKVYDAGNSTRETAKILKISRTYLDLGSKYGYFSPRSRAIANKLVKQLGKGLQVWTAQQRKAKSEEKKKLYAEHPEKHPNRRLANNRSKMSFPERIVYDYLTTKNIQFEHNKYIKPYWADFVINKTIIEVDGERWHNRDKDLKRDSHLNNYGYEVFRFKAKDIVKKVSIIDKVLNGIW